MKRQIITTDDGSKTIQIVDWDEQYHSKHGAINEANHVFIKQGLLHFYETSQQQNIRILEIGFGTGLNAFLTALMAEQRNLHIQYTGLEAYPVAEAEVAVLNYVDLIDSSKQALFDKMHKTAWERAENITEYFNLTKRQQLFADLTDTNAYDLIYFDAFGARVQPELWTQEIFEIMYNALKPNGVLVTYAAIGKVKRAMQAIGYKVERLQGPPGKRHMLRGSKTL